MGAAAGFAQKWQPQHTASPSGVYRPRRPQGSPLYRLIENHFDEFSTVYDERFARRWGYWRNVVAEVVEKYLACGILKHGFARVRCGGCRHEFLMAFSCKCRYFCPSCHAKRLALWGIWIEQTLPADVPHRQVVFAVPKRLRPYFFYDRELLWDFRPPAHPRHRYTHRVWAAADDKEFTVRLARYCARNMIALGHMEYDAG